MVRHAVENDPLPIQIPRPGDTHFVQFKEEKLIQLGHFFFFLEINRNFVYHKDFGRRLVTYHVTITLRDNSRYDLILKINETA